MALYLGKSDWEDTANNLLDYDTWVVGSSGSQPGFTKNGLDSENQIVLSNGPTGRKEAIWKCVPSGNSVADGGWITPNHNYDNTKAYRYTTFIRRTGDSIGKTYTGPEDGEGTDYFIECPVKPLPLGMGI